MNNGIFLKKTLAKKFSKNLAKKSHQKKIVQIFEPQTRKKDREHFEPYIRPKKPHMNALKNAI